MRQELMQLLAAAAMPVGVISSALGRPEKEVYDHLRQLNETKKLSTVPAECVKCGYVFQHRRKVTKPSKCPRCKSTRIKQPRYALKAAGE